MILYNIGNLYYNFFQNCLTRIRCKYTWIVSDEKQNIVCVLLMKFSFEFFSKPLQSWSVSDFLYVALHFKSC